MSDPATVVEALAPFLLASLAALAVLAWPADVRPWTPRSRAPSAVRGSADDGARQVAEAMDLMALALTGGGSVGAAAVSAGAVLPGQSGEELVAVGRAMEGGIDATAAWQGVGERWLPARQCLELADLAGVPPAEALSRAAADLRRESLADVEVAAARLGVVLVVPLGLAFLPAFVLTTIVPLVLTLLAQLAVT